MTAVEPKGPYIYQPYGMQDDLHWAAKRIYAIAGISTLAIVKGLTRQEAEDVLAVFKGHAIMNWAKSVHDKDPTPDPAPYHQGGRVMPELQCDDCQQPYAIWFAPNDIWNSTMGGPDATDDPGGMLCPRCFMLRAETSTPWEVRPKVAPDPSPHREQAEKLVADWCLNIGIPREQLTGGPKLVRLIDEAIANALAEVAAEKDKEIARYRLRELDFIDRADAAKAEVARLKEALKRLLLEFDFMVEQNIIPDVRADIIFEEARAALQPKEQT